MVSPSRRAVSAAAAVLALGLSALPAGADPQNLDRDLPLQVEDARPTEAGKWEFQLSTRYERGHTGGDQVTVLPQIQWGPAENWQLSVASPLIAGNEDRTGSGDIEFRALYRFMEDDGERKPSLAAAFQVDAPTGINSAGVDTTLELLASKGIDGDDNADRRVHVNLLWEHNAGEERDERENRILALIGYSQKLDEQTVLVADLYRAHEREADEESNVIEVGLIRELSEELTVSGGFGLGVGDESPDVIVTAGLQYSF